MKRIEQNSIICDGSIAKLNTNSFAISDDLKKYIKLEKQLVNKNLKDKPIFSGKINSEGIIEKENYHYTKELTDAYAAIINKYIELDNVPSLVYLDFNLRSLYEDFLNIFNKEVENIKENEKLNNNEKALHLNKIGVFETENQILISVEVDDSKKSAEEKVKENPSDLRSTFSSAGTAKRLEIPHHRQEH